LEGKENICCIIGDKFLTGCFGSQFFPSRQTFLKFCEQINVLEMLNLIVEIIQNRTNKLNQTEWERKKVQENK
jgi:hypothetical protein